MNRLRFVDLRMSRLGRSIVTCQADIPKLAQVVNDAQLRLLTCREAGDEGWWGTWAEVAFNTSNQTTPFITCPRGIARLEVMTVCSRPVNIQNQFYEYLRFGNGNASQWHWPRNTCHVQTYSRNNVATFVDLTNPPQLIHIYASDPSDVDTINQVLLQGPDANGNPVRGTDKDNNAIDGVYVTLDAPFATSPVTFGGNLTGIQKPITNGRIQIFQADPTTGAEILLVTMEPSETSASYRRYYLNNLPISCCPIPSNPIPQNVQVMAIAKLDLVPVLVDSDYCLIQSQEAIIQECMSMRHEMMDVPLTRQMAASEHQQAVRYLQGELVHYLGKDLPAIEFKPFGSANLGRYKIGTLI